MTYTSVDPEKIKKATLVAQLSWEENVQCAILLTMIEEGHFLVTKDILSLDYKPTMSLSQEYLLYEGRHLLVSVNPFRVMAM